MRASHQRILLLALPIVIGLYLLFGYTHQSAPTVNTAPTRSSYNGGPPGSAAAGSGGGSSSGGAASAKEKGDKESTLLYRPNLQSPVRDLSSNALAWSSDRFRELKPSKPRKLENAVLVMLVRNEELHAARFAIRGIEDRFNHRFGYDWVFLNDEPFTEEFVRLISGLTSGEAHFGLIPKQHWSYPDAVDQKKAEAGMKQMKEENIIYGDSLSYRHMCRFNSGFFYEHELMLKYDYYFRVEPFVEFYCDFYEDPFKLMREKGKKYGWVMAMYEYERTVPTLWAETKRFFQAYPQFASKRNSLHFLIDDIKKPFVDADWNLCHFWSNFEIGDLNWLRSDAYRSYFEWLDQAGGFFYERWGDAPVHSLAAAIMLDVDEIHHFGDVGYRHNPYTRCPPEDKYHANGQCSCNPEDNFDTNGYSCFHQWQDSFKAATNGEFQPLGL